VTQLSLGAPTPAAPVAAGTRPRVIGLDLSLTSTGIAYRSGATRAIKTSKDDGDRRLLHIAEEIRNALGGSLGIALGTPVELAVLEDLPKHAMAAGITGMVHGIARTVLLQSGVPYALISPATLKSYAADNGRASKRDLAAAAYLAAGREFPGDLTPKGEGGDQCDAWWLRAAGLDWLGAPEFTLPQAQRARLTKAKWPLGVAR
jgi:Holliday junction resolvasome RuvABC endonuclease subunit